jgi:radical SAM superfamily enzyme YgiQ (UPF0313 family)
MDMEAENLSKDQAVKEIEKMQPGIIGISSMSFTFLYTLELAKKIKQKMDVSIVFGGNHVSIYPREVISHSCIDIVVIGEGELTFLELVKVLENKKPVQVCEGLRKVNGIIFKSGGRTITTEPRKFIGNLDDLPYPAVDLLKLERYYGCNHSRPYMTVITSRGCPYQCSFCSKQPWGLSFRKHSAERIVDEIEYYVKRLGIKAIDFFDDTLTSDQNRIAQIINLVKKRKIKFEFGLLTRADLVSQKLLVGLREIGCRIISFGVESGVPRILKILNKEISIAKVKDAFRWANKAGISTVGFFMVGNPSETREEIKQTIKLVKELNADYVKANILIPYPGSKLYEGMLKEGRLNEDFWRKVTLTGKSASTPLFNGDIPRRQLIRFRNYINYTPYLRWRSNIFKFKKVKSVYDIKRTFNLLKNTFFEKEL